ncbi:MAG: phosphoribosylformylglycinamidine cyclo-ligase [Eggerthellaceae bacterium]|jgi:phosphoribosylformylglycinamidine cyclo-ligase|nr:phosphoribosylformylglycinamidine cyclo-ligase [Eggerthellaceae bacterium]MCH4221374.1 phosphoribosylformylglycinamidine cyclo-ligase [Eggerthellaceae bacterium]
MTERITVSAASENDAPTMPSWVAEDTVTYAQAGVDTAEGARAVSAIKDAVHSTYRDEVIGDIGGFGGLFSIAAAKDMEDPILVSGTDGVGTKLQVARLADKHDTIGIDLVAMCANDILATGAEPLFFLDYIAVGKLRSEAVSQVVAGVADGCRQAGCALVGGEMAEHPGVMDPHDYDVSGFCVGLVDRAHMLGSDQVKKGDVLLGLASSGLHSNGYSLARKVCVEGRTHYEVRLPRPELDGQSVQDALLVPTRIYVKAVRDAMHSCPGAIHSLAHITGGGITENLNRSLPDDLNACVEVGSWSMPPIIPYVCRAAHLSDTEALKTFNMGLGMILIVDPKHADDVIASLEASGEQVTRVGSIVEGSGEVTYDFASPLLPPAVAAAPAQPETPPAPEDRNKERDVFYEEDADAEEDDQ